MASKGRGCLDGESRECLDGKSRECLDGKSQNSSGRYLSLTGL